MPEKVEKIAKALIRKGYLKEEAYAIANSQAEYIQWDVSRTHEQLANQVLIHFRMERDLKELEASLEEDKDKE